jgi:hypothetical protein
VAKEIERQVHDGELVEPEETSQGVPADSRGQGGDNSGQSIMGWRAGRGQA